jgi:acetyl esterase/lipase
VVFGWGTACALWVPRRRGRFATVHYFSSMVINEVPVLAILGLAASTLLAWSQGDLDSTGGIVSLGVGLVVMAGLVVLAWRASGTRPALDRALDAGLGEGWRDQIDPGLAGGLRTDVPWLPGLLLPLRRRRGDVEHLRNLSYGEHGRHNTLDLYRHRSRPTGSPVLVHLHGGAFTSGRKDRESLPLIYRFASRGWLCLSANYRIGPEASFPDHLIDVKRILAWVQAHAEEYGGDPALVIVSGDSAGGHQALSAALTPNDPAYQPGFEDADTTVTAAIGLYGYYGQISVRPESSPAAHLRADAPPILLVAADHDSSVPIAWTRAFADQVLSTSQGPVVYAELPGAQHTFDLVNSVRTRVAVDRIEAFADWVRSR